MNYTNRINELSKSRIKKHSKNEQLFLVSIPILNMGYVLLLLLFMLSESNAQINCNSITLGSGSYYSCSNNKCELKHSTTFVVDSEGSKICVDIKTSDQDEDPIKFQAYVKNMYYGYPLIDCYTSGDPVVSFQSYCACTGNSVVDCANCPAVGVANQPQICNDGISRATGCLLSNYESTWCTIGSLDRSSQYTICNFGNPNYQVLMEISIGGVTSNVTFNQNMNYFDSNGYNVTLLAETFSSGLQDKMFILDNYKPSNYWVTPKAITNSISEFNMDKIGWQKTDNENFLTLLKSRVSTMATNCANDVFSHNIAAAAFGNTLANSTYDAKRQYPGSLYSSPKCPVNLFVFGQEDKLYGVRNTPLGVACYDTTGIVLNFGMSLDGESLAQMWQPGHPVVTGAIPVKTFAGTTITAVRCGNLLGTVNQLGQTVQYVQCTNKQQGPYTPGSLGICSLNNSVTPLTWVCDSNIGCREYPSGEFSNYVFADSQKIQVSNVPTIEEYPTEFFIPFHFKSLKLNLEGTFDSITLTENSMQPEIISVIETDGLITVRARSYQGKGTCLLSSNPHITEDVPIFLDFKEDDFELPTSVKKFSGSVTISIVCSRKTDKVKFKVEIERSDVNVDEESINDNNIREMSVKNSFVDNMSLNNGVTNFLWGTLDSILGNNWFSRMVYWIIVVAIISIVITLVLVILYYLANLIIFKTLSSLFKWITKPKTQGGKLNTDMVYSVKKTN